MATTQDRVCLRCNKTFPSAHKFNRICPLCSGINKQIEQTSSSRKSSKRAQTGRCIQDSRDGC